MRQPLCQKVDPAKTALIVIDIQVDFCAPHGYRGRRGKDTANMETMIDRLLPFIAAAEQAGVPVIYTQQIYDRDKLNWRQLEQYDLDDKFISCDPATNGQEFYRLDPLAKDVYPKYNYNIFSNPDLIKRLDRSDISTLIITGVDAQYCVETAIRNGFDLGYKIVVPTDLIESSSSGQEAKQNTLRLVEKTYGVVVDSSEITACWANRP
jgi:nicotinamidase-related amidase